MKIGFDGKRATQNSTGLGNYSRYLIRLLSKSHSENRYVIYAIKPPSVELLIPEAEYRYPHKQTFKSLWRISGIVKDLARDKIDLFHGLSNEIPFGLRRARIPSVVTIHDLIFIRYPQYYSFADRLIYKYKFRHAALQADKVIAISEQTKRDLMEYFGLKENKVQVIYQDCDPIFQKLTNAEVRNEVRKQYNLPEKYLLNVGTIEERKNLMLLVKALSKTNKIHLVVVGKETKYVQKVKNFISENRLTERVHFLQNLKHADLPAVYQMAEIFIYPSRFEGFGIPIVEALHSGTPVIAAKGSCLEEAGGPDSVYVDPDDETELANQIISILGNNEKRINMVNSGRLYLAKFDAKRISGQIAELYKNVIENA